MLCAACCVAMTCAGICVCCAGTSPRLGASSQRVGLCGWVTSSPLGTSRTRSTQKQEQVWGHKSSKVHACSLMALSQNVAASAPSILLAGSSFQCALTEKGCSFRSGFVNHWHTLLGVGTSLLLRCRQNVQEHPCRQEAPGVGGSPQDRCACAVVTWTDPPEPATLCHVARSSQAIPERPAHCLCGPKSSGPHAGSKCAASPDPSDPAAEAAGGEAAARPPRRRSSAPRPDAAGVCGGYRYGAVGAVFDWRLRVTKCDRHCKTGCVERRSGSMLPQPEALACKCAVHVPAPTQEC